LKAAKEAEAAAKMTPAHLAIINTMKGWTSNRDDKYYWTDVLETANELVEEEAVSFYNTEPKIETTLKKPQGKTAVLLQSGSEAALNAEFKEQLEATIAAAMDKVEVKNHAQFQEFKSLLNGLQAGKTPTQETTPKSWDNPSRPTSSIMRPVTSRDCFYCGVVGHFIGDCQKHHKDIDGGLIKVIDGRTTFFDGRPIPREPKNKTQQQKAQEYRARQSVNTNLLAYDLTEQFSLEEENTPEYDSTADEMRTLRAEKTMLRAALLQSQQGGSQSTPSASTIDGVPEVLTNRFAKAVNFLMTRWDDNNPQFIMTRGGAGGDSDPEGF
jgi:hypothetical protein